MVLPFLADEELISISGWKRIAAAFNRVEESKNDEKRDLRITAKVEDVWADGYVNLSNLRELNVRTLRNERLEVLPGLPQGRLPAREQVQVRAQPGRYATRAVGTHT